MGEKILDSTPNVCVGKKQRVFNPNKHFLPSSPALNSSDLKFYIRTADIQRENILCSNSL